LPGYEYYGSNAWYAAMLVDMGTGRRWHTFGWSVGRDLPGDVRPKFWRKMPPPVDSANEA
jgi:hypothetical protein